MNLWGRLGLAWTPADPFQKHNRTMRIVMHTPGDWMELNGKRVKVVEARIDGTILVSDGVTRQSGERVRYIALSPEILEGNDFWEADNVWSWWNDEQTQSVDIYWEYDVAHVEVENGLQTHIETRITDVHELQHLLSVADIDLDIKL